MNTLLAFETYLVQERYDRALKLIRGELHATDLDIVGEFDLAEIAGDRHRPKRPQCRVLLVDNPLLVFEALALDRAAAVFFPLHILVFEVEGQTQATVVNPARLLDARFPAGAADPMDRLVARAELALQSAAERRAGSGSPSAGEKGYGG